VNAYAALSAALPDAPVLVGRVVAHHEDDTSTVELPIGVANVGAGGIVRGSRIRPRGRTVPVGGWAFVRRGRIENRAPPPEGDVVLLPPLPQTPPDNTSGWRTDAWLQEGFFGGLPVPDIQGPVMRFGEGSADYSMIHTMGVRVNTAGKRYFAIQAVDMTTQAYVGYAVGTYAQPRIQYVEGEQWCELYDNSGGQLGRDTLVNASDSAGWSYALTWDDLGQFFNAPTGVYGFYFDLDAGRLDYIDLNGAELYVAGTQAVDRPGLDALAQWAPGAPVQPYVRERFIPDGGTGELLLISGATPTRAGYLAWDAP
jgi:hypothetical protein